VTSSAVQKVVSSDHTLVVLFIFDRLISYTRLYVEGFGTAFDLH